MQVTLIDHMGDDLRVVNAARVSYAKRSDWDRGPNFNPAEPQAFLDRPKTLKDADKGLIRYLIENHHETPFEMVVFTFHVVCPIGVGREWMRHRIGSFNEVSTRYVEMDPDCYMPMNNAVRTQVGKPGHYRFEQMPRHQEVDVRTEMAEAYDTAHKHYQMLLSMGVAKELARNVLPLGQMTQFYWTVNLRSLFNFLKLRMHNTALLEIRLLAKQVYDLAQPIAPVSFEQWRLNNTFINIPGEF